MNITKYRNTGLRRRLSTTRMGSASPHTNQATLVQRGFTIVELLIVIVVIAILAAISIVAYTGIQNRAHDSAIQNDLRQIGQRLEMYHVERDYYPTPQNGANMAELGLSVSRDSYADRSIVNNTTHNLFYCHTQNGNGDIALVATAASGKSWQYSGGTVRQYSGRSGHTVTVCADAGSPTSSMSDLERTIIRVSGNWLSWVN